MKTSKLKRIPIKRAEEIAKTYGYDQVIVIARKVGQGQVMRGEWITTYGVNKEHCASAAQQGAALGRLYNGESALVHLSQAAEDNAARDAPPAFEGTVDEFEALLDKQEVHHPADLFAGPACGLCGFCKLCGFD